MAPNYQATEQTIKLFSAGSNRNLAIIGESNVLYSLLVTHALLFFIIKTH